VRPASVTQFQVAAQLSSFGAPPAHATATIALRTRAERLHRALLGGSVCIAGAAAGLFIPLAHFFLVPGFLCAGVVLVSKRLREDRALIRLHGACPACGALLDLTPGGPARGGREVRCTACRRSLALAIDAESWPREARG
jgi:hypothetical protein